LSARSAISIANPSDSVVYVTLELRDLQGKPTGLSSQLQLPPLGHTGAFLHELVGFINMPQEFEGILHVTATGPRITMYSLRARYNESGQFIATTTGPLQPVSGPVVFPHVVNGSGYATKIVFLNADSGGSINGALRFQLETGEPLFVGLVPGNGFNGQ